MEAIFATYLPILVAIGAFIGTYIVIPSIIDVSHFKGLFDDPGDDRKLHNESVPNLGGVAIFGVIFVCFTLSGYALVPWSPYLAAGLTLLFFSGMKDDIVVTSANTKFLIQFIAIGALMAGGDLVITDLGGVFGIHEISYEAGAGLTFFTMLVVLNAYNLIDGIDGLAGGVGIIASLFFGWWFWEVGMMSHVVLASIVFGSLLAFMRYNFQPASIFMGDTGSQIIGYLLAFFAVSFVQAGVTATQSVPFQNEIPVLVVALLIVPLYDTLRVFLVRTLHGKSPFAADRRHVHHQLIDAGFSHSGACYILYAYNLGIVGLTISMAGMNVNILLAVVLLTTVVLFPTAGLKRQLLTKLGVKLPSRRQIQVAEMKYGTHPSRPSKMKKNGDNIGHTKKENEEKVEKREKSDNEKVVV